jgi:hypothetical protein
MHLLAKRDHKISDSKIMVYRLPVSEIHKKRALMQRELIKKELLARKSLNKNT